MYGPETWRMTTVELVQLQAFHLQKQGQIVCIKWNDFVTNAAVTEQG